jgi:hypothetical protein
MHRIGAAPGGRINESVDTKVAVARGIAAHPPRLVGHPHVEGRAIAVAVDGHRRNAHVAAGAHDAHGDLTAVGD